MSIPTYYTVKEIADKFDMKERTVRHWCQKKISPCESAYRLLGRGGWRVPKTDIDSALQSTPSRLKH